LNHPHFIIGILSSVFYHPHFIVRHPPSAIRHPPSAIRHPPSAIRRPVLHLERPERSGIQLLEARLFNSIASFLSFQRASQPDDAQLKKHEPLFLHHFQ